MADNTYALIISIGGLVIGAIAIFDPQYTLIMITAISLIIIGYSYLSIFNRLNILEQDMKKLIEKLNIHKELINIKADIKNLKKGDHK